MAVLRNKALKRYTADRRLTLLVQSFLADPDDKPTPDVSVGPTHTDADDLRDCPAAAPFINWRAANRPLIASTVAELGGVGQLEDDAHWDLISEMKDALGESAANSSTDDSADQESALMDAETWVASELGDGLLEEDVAMALWLGHKDSQPTVLDWLKANLDA